MRKRRRAARITIKTPPRRGTAKQPLLDQRSNENKAPSEMGSTEALEPLQGASDESAALTQPVPCAFALPLLATCMLVTPAKNSRIDATRRAGRASGVGVGVEMTEISPHIKFYSPRRRASHKSRPAPHSDGAAKAKRRKGGAMTTARASPVCG